MAPRTVRVKKEAKSEEQVVKKFGQKLCKEEVLSDNINVKSANVEEENISNLKNYEVTNTTNTSNKTDNTVSRGRGRKTQKKKEFIDEQLDQENIVQNNATNEANLSPFMEASEEEKVEKVKKPKKATKPSTKKMVQIEHEDDVKNITPVDEPKGKVKIGETKKNLVKIKDVNTVPERTSKRGGKKPQAKDLSEIDESNQMNIVDEEISEKISTAKEAKVSNKKNKQNRLIKETMNIDSTDNESKVNTKTKNRVKKISNKLTVEESATSDKMITDEDKFEIIEKEVNKVGLKDKVKNTKATVHSDKAILKEELQLQEENKLSGKNRKKVTIQDEKTEIEEKSKGKTKSKGLRKPDSDKINKDLEQSNSQTSNTYKTKSAANDFNDEPALALISEPKTKQAAKGKRGLPKKTQQKEENDAQDQEGPPTKRRKEEEKKPLKNKAATDYDSIDFSNSSKNEQGLPWNLKISSWNVDGIRAWLTKGGLDYIKHEKPDILCLQEVKCSQEKLPEEVVSIPGYHPYWLCSDKDGYAGVAVYTTKMAISVQYGLQDEELDAEGRLITVEYEQFYLISTYVPNAGRKLITLPKRLKWNEVFHRFVKELDSKKPVIICGDMNVAHNEIDLTNPKTNKKNAGFTQEERDGMTALLNDGFVDTFRKLYSDTTGAYTFWTYMMNCRAKNVGWRLDYLIISERLLPTLCDSVIRSEVFGSDHCPISLFLHLSSVPKIPTE